MKSFIIGASLLLLLSAPNANAGKLGKILSKGLRTANDSAEIIKDEHLLMCLKANKQAEISSSNIDELKPYHEYLDSLTDRQVALNTRLEEIISSYNKLIANGEEVDEGEYNEIYEIYELNHIAFERTLYDFNILNDEFLSYSTRLIVTPEFYDENCQNKKFYIEDEEKLKDEIEAYKPIPIITKPNITYYNYVKDNPEG